MGKELTLIVNTAECVGCSACEVACKQEHNLPVGPRLIRVYFNTPRLIEDRWQARYTVTHCMHCSKPSCKDVCPTNAISKREDGIVLIKEDLCTGCKQCIEACPLGVMQFEEEKRVAQKCDLCIKNIDKGLSPACVNVCPSHCISFSNIDKITELVGKQRLLVWFKGSNG